MPGTLVETDKQMFVRRRAECEKLRTSQWARFIEISDSMDPKGLRRHKNDIDSPEKHTKNILDATPQFEAEALEAAIMSNVTPASQPWARLKKSNGVPSTNTKLWIHNLQDQMEKAISESNFNELQPKCYHNIIHYGIYAKATLEDYDKVFKTVVYPVGSFLIDVNADGECNYFIAETKMTARQAIEEYGMLPNGEINREIFSTAVTSAYDNGTMDALEIEVAIEYKENKNYKKGSLDPKKRRYSINHYEVGAPDLGQNKYLSQTGIEYWPIQVVWWDKNKEDRYASTCPAMKVVAEIKELYFTKRSKTNNTSLVNVPPILADPSMKNEPMGVMAGFVTYASGNIKDGFGYKAAYQVPSNGESLRADIDDLRKVIRRGFYADIVRMLTDDQRKIEITATETLERKKEAMQIFGPLMARFERSDLRPTAKLVIYFLLKQGRVPPPPPDLLGLPEVEIVNMLAQALKMYGLAILKDICAFAEERAALTPEVMDNLDMDAILAIYVDNTGGPPQILRDEKIREQIRQARATANARAQQIQAASLAAKTAKDMGTTPLQPETVLGNLALAGAGTGQ